MSKKPVYMTAAELLDAAQNAPSIGVKTVHRLVAEVFRLRAKVREDPPVFNITQSFRDTDPDVAVERDITRTNPLTLEERRTELQAGLNTKDIDRCKIALNRLARAADEIEREVMKWEMAFSCDTPAEAIEAVATAMEIDSDLVRSEIAREICAVQSMPPRGMLGTLGWEVVLVAFSNKIGTIKAIREITGCGLHEAKLMVETLPRAVKAQTSKEEAEVVRRKLVESGATVSLRQRLKSRDLDRDDLSNPWHTWVGRLLAEDRLKKAFEAYKVWQPESLDEDDDFSFSCWIQDRVRLYQARTLLQASDSETPHEVAVNFLEKAFDAYNAWQPESDTRSFARWACNLIQPPSALDAQPASPPDDPGALPDDPPEVP